MKTITDELLERTARYLTDLAMLADKWKVDWNYLVTTAAMLIDSAAGTSDMTNAEDADWRLGLSETGGPEDAKEES